LRSKGFARDVNFTGSRVEKYRHTAGEKLDVRAPELAILSELLLRGPQTVGELRGRASRMHPFDSLEAVESVLASLANREEPLVKEYPPLPGSRAPRWIQLLCPDLHPITAGAWPSAEASAPVSSSREAQPDERDERIAALESRVADLERAISELRTSLGVS
jgi:uncharacterized protein YceH (UPF0502 family)